MDHEIGLVESVVGSRTVINGREYDYYAVSSYYNLHKDDRVKEAACEAIRKYGMGPSGAGPNLPLIQVEHNAAEFFEVEKAQYIVSGYLGNMLLVQALREDYDIVFVDSFSHYSVFDGIRSTGKRIMTFEHLDANDLERKLRETLKPREVPMVITDGVFPTTGAIAPLKAYATILASYEHGLLCVDDAHAVGVIGEKGQGTLEFCGLKGSTHYHCGTLSKAFGGHGGIIPGDQELMDKIRRNTRVSVGANPPPPASAAASAMGMRILMEHPEMRRKLWSNTTYVRAGLREMGFEVDDSPVPIIPVKALPRMDLKQIYQELERKGILLEYVVSRGYSDAPNEDMLCIRIFSTHTRLQMDRLLGTLEDSITNL